MMRIKIVMGYMNKISVTISIGSFADDIEITANGKNNNSSLIAFLKFVFLLLILHFFLGDPRFLFLSYIVYTFFVFQVTVIFILK